MLAFKRVLAIGAHPDDIEFGCLGFLLKQGPDVETHLYVASLGSAGDPTSGEHRQRESEAACAAIRPKSLNFRARAGVEASDFHAVTDELFGLIEKHRPDLILTLGPHDTHQEHRHVYEATLSAARRSKASLLSYGILSNTPDFNPTLFVDISSVYARKKESLRCHRSQAGKYYMTDEYLDIFHSHTYASLHGLRFCERFSVIRIFS